MKILKFFLELVGAFVAAIDVVLSPHKYQEIDKKYEQRF